MTWMTALFVLSWSLCYSQDTTVCKPTTVSNPGPAKPKLPDTFTMHVEANILNKNSTVDVREWHDGTGNRGASRQWVMGFPLTYIYDYDTWELFILEQLADGDYSCKVRSLNSTDQPYLIGVQGGTSIPVIYDTSHALSFGGGGKESYKGQFQIRGIWCDLWQSCVFWSDLNATMTVDWYFSVAQSWDTAVGMPQVPVRCHVTGKRSDGNTARRFEHIYEVSEFHTYLDEGVQIFETPPGTVCAGRKKTKATPTLPMTFSYGAEVLSVEQKYTQYIKKAYDGKGKMAMLEFAPYSSPTNRLRQIDDFNTGASYTIDLVSGNCNITYIDPVGFDAVRNGTNMLRMRTPHEFFFSTATDYTYEGIRNIRGLNTDVWIGKQIGWPPTNPSNSTWEYYFLTPEWDEEAGTGSTTSQPVAIHVAFGMQEVHQVYNLYNFRDDDPFIWQYDITTCFDPDLEIEDLQLLFQATTGLKRQAILTNKNAFIRSIKNTITSLVPISPIRINNIHFDITYNSVLVTLTLTEKVTLNQPIVEGAILQEMNLLNAVKQLHDVLASGDFVVTLATSDANMTFVAQPNIKPAPPPTGSAAHNSKGDQSSLGFASQSLSKTNVFNPAPAAALSGKASAKTSVLLCSQKTTDYTPGDVAGVSMGMAFAGYLIVFFIMVIKKRWQDQGGDDQNSVGLVNLPSLKLEASMD